MARPSREAIDALRAMTARSFWPEFMIRGVLYGIWPVEGGIAIGLPGPVWFKIRRYGAGLFCDRGTGRRLPFGLEFVAIRRRDRSR